ncbi:hypothetical protein Q1695_007343 [Nippostrongylus brasiliensis]|nr:hypothetical protein Q1695_007343 [Nippostrongylus brasiliensis]
MSREKRCALLSEEHVSLQGSPLSPWTPSQQLSLHEMRMADAVKVGPGRYRLNAPKIPTAVSLTIDRILRPARDPLSPSSHSHETQSSLATDIAYMKMVALSDKKAPRKRAYFCDDQITEISSKKPVRIVKQMNAKYQDPSQILLEKGSKNNKDQDIVLVNSTEEDCEEADGLLVESTIDVDNYEEVPLADDYHDGAGPSIPSFITSDNREVVNGNMYRELKGENVYLKQQLQASVLRVKQLEALLIERNTHVKKLVSENVQLSMKCRKLMNALTEEEAKEALS